MPKLENGVMRYDQTETNKLAKTALQKAFPEVTFSVKAMSGSGMYGRSHIEWLDGPTEKEVEAIVLRFKGYVDYQGQKSHFDFDPSWRREYSPIFQIPCAQKLADEYGAKFEIVPANKHALSYIRFTPNYLPGKMPDDLSTLLWRMMKDISACGPAEEEEPTPALPPAPSEQPTVTSSRMTAEEYDAKRQARYERLLARAEKAESESAANWQQAHNMADVIPFGQPILVGHHSEKRDRNYRAKIEAKHRKGYELHQKAERLRERAKAAQNNHAIFSDDPAATEKLADKIKRLEARQEMMKKANKLVRANDREGLAELGFSERVIAELFTPDYMGRVGFPSYAITNNGANIRSTKQRLEQLEKRANDTTKETTIGDIRVVENVEANRLQIFFPGKPAAAVIKDLKSRGFRWTPSEGCWQAYLTNQARYQAECIVGKPETVQAAPIVAPEPKPEPAHRWVIEPSPAVLLIGPNQPLPTNPHTGDGTLGVRVWVCEKCGKRLGNFFERMNNPTRWGDMHQLGEHTFCEKCYLAIPSSEVKAMIEQGKADFDPELWASGD